MRSLEKERKPTHRICEMKKEQRKNAQHLISIFYLTETFLIPYFDCEDVLIIHLIVMPQFPQTKFPRQPLTHVSLCYRWETNSYFWNAI